MKEKSLCDFINFEEEKSERPLFKYITLIYI